MDGRLRAEKDLQTRKGVSWFKEAKRLPAGSLFVTPVQIARNTGEPEIRVASPVYLGNTFHGVVVINADWRLAWELLSDNVYGRTGYPYIVNNKEQSSGIEQVNIAVSEMDKVVQQNAAVAEESASAAEEMSAQAE